MTTEVFWTVLGYDMPWWIGLLLLVLFHVALVGMAAGCRSWLRRRWIRSRAGLTSS